jgi:hypothetical protein
VDLTLYVFTHEQNVVIQNFLAVLLVVLFLKFMGVEREHTPTSPSRQPLFFTVPSLPDSGVVSALLNKGTPLDFNGNFQVNPGEVKPE